MFYVRYELPANTVPKCYLNPNVADLLRGKTRYSALDVVAHSLGQDEAYFTVREILGEASTAADGVL
ncbi:MAG: hypothetical protein V3R70_09120 [Syntrophobacteria bacterium]